MTSEDLRVFTLPVFMISHPSPFRRSFNNNSGEKKTLHFKENINYSVSNKITYINV